MLEGELHGCGDCRLVTRMNGKNIGDLKCHICPPCGREMYLP